MVEALLKLDIGVCNSLAAICSSEVARKLLDWILKRFSLKYSSGEFTSELYFNNRMFKNVYACASNNSILKLAKWSDTE